MYVSVCSWKKEAVYSCETLTTIHVNTRCLDPENHNLHFHTCTTASYSWKFLYTLVLRLVTTLKVLIFIKQPSVRNTFWCQRKLFFNLFVYPIFSFYCLFPASLSSLSTRVPPKQGTHLSSRRCCFIHVYNAVVCADTWKLNVYIKRALKMWGT